MSIIYLENQYQISSETLKQISQAESIPHINEVKESLADALKFAWQWLRGDTTFEQATSGSTGSPKKIIIHRDQIVASAQATIQALGLDESNSSLLCLSARYVGGKMMVVRSLLANMDLVIVRPASNPLLYLPFLPKFAAMVPLQVQTLLDKKEAAALNQMKAIIIGGAPVSNSLETQITHELTISVYSTYGMTETVSHIALKKLTPHHQNFYQVLAGNQIAIDERNCLKIKGKVTRDTWVVTNDLVEIVGDRQFRWLGRYDSVINSGGVKVFPEEVERVLEPILRQANFSGRFLVSSLPDRKLGERVILILESRLLLDNSQEKRILDEVQQQLAPYQVPKSIHYLPQFAETPTGKVQRSQTQQWLQG
ncbi:MAG: AMP-binding protein [Bacteroidota bacterium]